MKKILIFIFIIGFLASCGGDVTSDGGSNKNTAGNAEDQNPCENTPVGDDGETPPTIPCSN